MSDQTKGTFIALIGIVFWSTTAIFIGYLLTNYDFPPLVLAFWRNIFVCLILIPTLFLIRRSLLRISRAQIGFFILYGFILAIFNSTWTISVEYNGAAVSTVLIYSSAGFTAILARWLFKESLGLPKILAVILSLLGMVMVSNAYNPDILQLNPIGVSAGIFSGLMFAIYSLAGKEVVNRKINPWTALLYSFGIGAVFILIFNLFPAIPGAPDTLGGILPDMDVVGWLMLVILSFVPTLLGYGLYNTSMNYLPASIANIMATLEPVMTAIQAYILLGEYMTIVQIIGGLIILSGVVMVQFERGGAVYTQPLA